MKKLIFAAVCLFIVSCILSSCKSNNELPTNQENSNDKVKLSLMFYFEGQNRFALINNLCNSFNSGQKKIDVTPDFVPFEDLKKSLLTGLAQGDPPDLIIYDKPDFAYLAERGALEDITEKVNAWPDAKQYYENSMNACVYNGRAYGISIGDNCLELFYNKRMFGKQKLDPPTTWDELKITAKKLTGNGVYGIGICAQNSEQGMFQFLPWFYSAEANLKKLDSPEAVKAFKFLAGMIADGSMSNEIINWSQADVMKQFADEKIAMMLNGPWQLSELKVKAPNLEYGIAKIPMDKKSVTILGGENISVVKWENSTEAFEFLKFFCNAGNVKTFTEAMGYFPARKDVIISESLMDPEARLFRENVHYAIPRGPDPDWPEMSRIVTNALHEVLSLKKTPEEAAGNAQAIMEKFLK